MKTLVVIPTYIEAENVADILRRVRAAAPTVDILIVDDNSPDGTADLARAAGEELGQIEVLVRPGKGGLGVAYRAGFEHGFERGLRGPRPDGRRLLAPAGEAPRAARHASRRAPTSPSGRATSPAAARRRGRSGAAPAVAHRQHLRLHDARPAGQRRHGRLPGLPGLAAQGDRGGLHPGHRLRLPGRAQLPGAPARGQHRRGADHLHRPHPRRVEDVVAHHRRGHVARDLVGLPRPGAGAPGPARRPPPRRRPSPTPPRRSRPACRRPTAPPPSPRRRHPGPGQPGGGRRRDARAGPAEPEPEPASAEPA